MKIAVDLRSLGGGYVSGVENYIINALGNLLALDKQNTYLLFYNSFKSPRLHEFNFINSETRLSRIPNKLLNLALLLKLVKFESLTGPADVLFLPNLNQYAVNDKTRLALTVHDMSPVIAPEFYDLKRRVWHWLLRYKKSFRRANVIFAVSEYTKRDIIKLYEIEEHKIKVVYPGIDHDVYHPNIPVSFLREMRNKYELPAEYMVFVNTIEPRKNLPGLIKAFELVDGNTHLVIIGRRGWKHGGIFKQISQSRKSRSIHYLGYVENEQDKAAIIKLSKCLVYPSFYEGFGFQPLEAMALGVPAVVSQVTALPEVSGGAAMLVNPHDAGSIAKGIWQVLNNESLRKDLIEKGIAHAAKFTWNKTAENMLIELNNMR